MRFLRACYDWRVITVVTAVGIGTYVTAPRLVATVVPLLLLAVCPLSMLLMMRSMGSQEAAEPVIDVAEASPTALRRKLAAIARQQTQLTAELEALEDRDRREAIPDRESRDGPRLAMRPERRTRRSPQGPSQM